MEMQLVGRTIHYVSRCKVGQKVEYLVNGSAYESKWLPYAASYARFIVRRIMGAKLTAVETVNAAVFMHPFLSNVRNCSWYMSNFKDSKSQYDRCVLVGKDGKHCGVIDYSYNWFVHSDPKKKVVTRVPIVQAEWYFKSGFTYKQCAYADE